MDDTSLIKKAIEADLEVIWAKGPNDAKLEGLHLPEPTYRQIIQGIDSALKYGVKKVIIHSKLTWPYYVKTRSTIE